MLGNTSEQKEVNYQSTGLGQSRLPLLGMACAVNNWGKTDAWLKPNEKDQLSKLLGVKVLAARAHAAPRNKLFKNTIPKQKVRRLTVMLSEDLKTNLVDDDGMSSRKLDESWKGVTVFYICQADQEEKQACFLDTPEGLVPVWMTESEMQDVAHVYQTWKDVYTLQLKAGGKELDPKYFDWKERSAFNKSDAEEWDQWVKNRVIRVLTPHEERQVPKDKIFSSPLRFVRTSKGERKRS